MDGKQNPLLIFEILKCFSCMIRVFLFYLLHLIVDDVILCIVNILLEMVVIKENEMKI
jgi:hypothetical protein